MSSSPRALLSLVLVLLLLLLACSSLSLVSCQQPSVVDILPQQVHIAFGYTPSTVVVQWVTWAAPTSATVSYGLSPSSLNLSSPSSFHTFTDGGSARLNRTVHTATLPKLLPSRTYTYRIDVRNATDTYHSSIFTFRTLSATAGTGGGGEPIRVGMIGDYGLVNGQQTHNSLARLATSGGLDLLVHVGDFAYNMDDENGTRGDAFMQREEEVVARVPYMVAVGNHEAAYNFSHYRERFSMPNEASGSPTPLYSSFNVGPIHFVSLDVERYFFTQYYDMQHLRMQFEWLQTDLEKATRNRAQQPWIVAFAHRPMYCTHIHNDWEEPYCTEDAASVRDGVAFHGGARMYGLEQLFHQHGVALYVSGHMHSYERTYPVYREQVMNRDYNGNQGTFHIIAGAAGCQEYLDTFDEDAVYPWSAARSDSYGYGVLTVYNATHAHWAQILDEDESVMDQTWITQDDPALTASKQAAAAASSATAKTAINGAKLRGRHQ